MLDDRMTFAQGVAFCIQCARVACGALMEEGNVDQAAVLAAYVKAVTTSVLEDFPEEFEDEPLNPEMN